MPWRRGSAFTGGTWSDQRILGEDLAGVLFQDCTFERVAFEGVVLEQTMFLASRFDECTFDDCRLVDTRWVECRGTGFSVAGGGLGGARGTVSWRAEREAELRAEGS